MGSGFGRSSRDVAPFTLGTSDRSVTSVREDNRLLSPHVPQYVNFLTY